MISNDYLTCGTNFNSIANIFKNHYKTNTVVNLNLSCPSNHILNMFCVNLLHLAVYLSINNFKFSKILKSICL